MHRINTKSESTERFTSMEDELEDKLIYKTLVSHAKLISKFAMGLPIDSSYFGYCWRMLRIHILKPEIMFFTLIIFIVLAYIQNLNFRSQSFLKNFRFPVINNDSSVKKFQLHGIKDGVHWAYNTGNVAVFAIQGRRPSMEDRFVVSENIKDTGVSLFAIFDGHGGEVRQLQHQSKYSIKLKLFTTYSSRTPFCHISNRK